ncbi:MAG: VOC family protein [Pseudomonadota bacterium]
MGAPRPPQILPYLTVRDARAMLAFCADAFGGETVMVMEDAGGISHARTQIGEGLIMMYEERAGAYRANRAPQSLSGSPVAIRIELTDAAAVDATFARATALGAEEVVTPVDRPWGRLAEVRDPQGHIWRLASTAGAD